MTPLKQQIHDLAAKFAEAVIEAIVSTVIDTEPDTSSTPSAPKKKKAARVRYATLREGVGYWALWADGVAVCRTKRKSDARRVAKRRGLTIMGE